MALMTTAEVKSILKITDSTYDTDIEFLLPIVEDDLIYELNNAFQDGYVYRQSGTAFEFVRGDSDTKDYITDKEEEFLVHGFRDGMDIVIEGGFSNVGLYTIDSASSGTLKLDEYGELIPQDLDDNTDDHTIGQIRISRVKWPKALKLPAAKMVWSLIDDSKPSDAQSESIDDYSITYFGVNAYPTKIIRMLDKWRRPRFR